MTFSVSNKMTYEWMHGFAYGIKASEDYFLEQLIADGLLNEDFSGADLLDPSKSEKSRKSLLRLLRKIISSRATVGLFLRK